MLQENNRHVASMNGGVAGRQGSWLSKFDSWANANDLKAY